MSSEAPSYRTMIDRLGGPVMVNPTLGVSPDVEITMEMKDIPGVSIARLSPTRELSCEIHGTDLNGNDLTSDTKFQAASLSKPVFAYLVQCLVKDGLFDLDRPLSEIIPNDPLLAVGVGAVGDKGFVDLEAGTGGTFVSNDAAQTAQLEAMKKITARMVLSHTTGLHIGDSTKPLSFEPGTEFAYSGVGINLLQHAVETETGRDLSSLADEYVFNPLELSQTSFEGHPDSGGKVLAANSLKTTPADYAKLIRAWVLDESLAEAFKPQISLTTDHWAKSVGVKDENLSHLAWGLGMGLELDDDGNAITAYHTGDMSEWRAFFAVDLKTKEVCVFMANSEQGLLLADPVFEDSQNIKLSNASAHFFQKYGFTRSLEEPINPDVPSFRKGFSVPKVEEQIARPAYGEQGHTPVNELTDEHYEARQLGSMTP